MQKKRLCPKCGRNLAHVDETSIATLDDLGIANETGAVCFCCPECRAILGITPNLDWLETDVSNIPAAVEELRQKSARLSRGARPE